MNLPRMADSENSCTGKVNHDNVKLSKILQSITDSPELSFRAYMCVVSKYSIEMDGSMDRSSQSVTWCRIAYDHTACSVTVQRIDKPVHYV